MKTKDTPELVFSLTIWLGIIVNLAFALPALFFPDKLQQLLALEPLEQTIWLRNVGMLISGLCLLYLPVALSPARNDIYPYLVVGIRFIAAAFWVYMNLIIGLGSSVNLMLFTDFGMGILQASALAWMKYSHKNT